MSGSSCTPQSSGPRCSIASPMALAMRLRSSGARRSFKSMNPASPHTFAFSSVVARPALSVRMIGGIRSTYLCCLERLRQMLLCS